MIFSQVCSLLLPVLLSQLKWLWMRTRLYFGPHLLSLCGELQWICVMVDSLTASTLTLTWPQTAYVEETWMPVHTECCQKETSAVWLLNMYFGRTTVLCFCFCCVLCASWLSQNERVFFQWNGRRHMKILFLSCLIGRPEMIQSLNEI